MTALLAIAQTSAAMMKWLATMLALAMAVVQPAPRRAQERHHVPVSLPELASAMPLGLCADASLGRRA